jgi:hypothetical protein
MRGSIHCPDGPILGGLAMRNRAAIHSRRSLKLKMKSLRRTWKKSRYRPGKGRFAFYRYLDEVFDFYSELRRTKGAANNTRDEINRFRSLPSTGAHALNAIIRGSSKENARTQSRWARALRYAWKWRHDVKSLGLTKFLELNGGPAGCATKFTKKEPPVLK